VIVIFVCCSIFSFSIETNAQKRKAKNTQTTKSVIEISDDDRRKTVENMMLQGSYLHDGSGELMYIGTIESVPALLKVLETYPPIVEIIEDEPPEVKKSGEIITLSETPKVKREPRKSYICTYAHAIAALQKITQQKFIDYEDWKNWWAEYLKNKEIAK